MFKTNLANYIYEYSSLPKYSINKKKVKELSEAFCTRAGCLLVNVSSEYLNNTNIFIVFIDKEESLELFSDWKRSFEDLGYSEIPLLQGL